MLQKIPNLPSLKEFGVATSKEALASKLKRATRWRDRAFAFIGGIASPVPAMIISYEELAVPAKMSALEEPLPPVFIARQLFDMKFIRCACSCEFHSGINGWEVLRAYDPKGKTLVVLVARLATQS